MALGDTYDPTTLSRLGALGLKGDEAVARSYYSRALAAGVGGARERIAALAAQVNSAGVGPRSKDPGGTPGSFLREGNSLARQRRFARLDRASN